MLAASPTLGQRLSLAPSHHWSSSFLRDARGPQGGRLIWTQEQPLSMVGLEQPPACLTSILSPTVTNSKRYRGRYKKACNEE